LPCAVAGFVDDPQDASFIPCVSCDGDLCCRYFLRERGVFGGFDSQQPVEESLLRAERGRGHRHGQLEQLLHEEAAERVTGVKTVPMKEVYVDS
jgi:hypothetical protein